VTEGVWKHLPYAIYLDTNALRAAGLNLDKQWINELLSITNQFGMSLCISELVLAEWCEHIIEVLESNRQRLLSSITLLKQYDIAVPNIKPDEISLPEKTRLIEVVSSKLKAAGFKVIPNWDAPLSRLLSEAVGKKPPFGEGGKGLCDAVILESYAKHAKENFAEPRVLVVSQDGAVKRSEDRFKEHNIVVDFVSESDIVKKIKSLLSVEQAASIEAKKLQLREYILTYEPTILDFVSKTPLKITDWMLYLPSTEQGDRINGTIEGILSVKPVKIIDVIGGVPTYGVEIALNRYPVTIFVEIEMNIVVREYSTGGLLAMMQPRAIVQPKAFDGKTLTPLENTFFDRKAGEVTKTIKSSVTVGASLDAEKEKVNVLDDFRIERIP